MTEQEKIKNSNNNNKNQKYIRDKSFLRQKAEMAIDRHQGFINEEEPVTSERQGVGLGWAWDTFG